VTKAVNARGTLGGTAKKEVLRQIERAEKSARVAGRGEKGKR